MAAPAHSSTPTTDDVVVITRLLRAPQALAFQVWTSPEHLVRWFGPTGYDLVACELDFRVGGTYRFCMRSPEGRDHWVSGVYREIVEPERLAFTWNRRVGDVEDISESLVTVTFEPQNDKTLLTLRHEGLRSAKDRVDHRGGWSEALQRLVELVEAT